MKKKNLKEVEELKRKIEKLEKEIEIVQKSTKTTFPVFIPLHNFLRSKSRFYYNWHLNPYAGAVHIGFLILYGLLIILGAYLHFPTPKPSVIKVSEKAKVAGEIEFVSNEILIKIKKDFRRKILFNPSPSNTGLIKLNGINKKSKVKKFEQSVKPEAKSKKDHDLFSWYKITLSGEGKILHGDPSSSFLPEETGFINLTLEGVLQQYLKSGVVQKAEPNYIYHTQAIPNDYYYSTSQILSWGDLWGLQKIQTTNAWDKTVGNPNLVVAVVDTGVDYNHPDLKNSILKDTTGKIIGYDFHNNDSDPMDDNGHGTHVSGTIGAIGNNDPDHSKDLGTRTVGVNWNVKIMPVKGIGADGTGYGDRLVNGLRFAVDNGAKVLSNSWGTDSVTDYFHDAISYAYSNNVVAVFAAGNSHSDVSTFSPAGDPMAITAAATNHNDQKAAFSNYGVGVDVSAPGGDAASSGGIDDYILSTRSSQSGSYFSPIGTNGNYALARGTSMAAPHVSGLAALILAAHPDFSVEEVRAALRNTADKIEGKEWSYNTSYGRINASSAVNVTLAPPEAKIISPYRVPLVTSNSLTLIGTASSRYGLQKYELSLGQGIEPASWTSVGIGTSNVKNGNLGTINLTPFSSDTYTIKLVTIDNKGQQSQDRLRIMVEREILGGWPKNLGSSSPKNQSTLADLDGDGKNEIIHTLYSYLYVWQADGTSKSGFPKNLDVSGGWATSNDPVIADLDGDGKKEIIVSALYAYHSSNPVYARIFIFRSDGSNFSPAWPKELTGENRVCSPASVADLNKDGTPEIIAWGRILGKVYTFKTDGSVLSGWGNTTVPAAGYTDSNTRDGAPSIADVNGDGSLEVFLSNFDGKVYGFKADGSNLAGWPQSTGKPNAHSTVALGDINGDSKLEVVAKGTVSLNTLDGSGTISTWTATGQLLWRYYTSYPYLNPGAASAALVNIDGQAGKEIFIDDNSGFYGLNGSGKDLPGWPVHSIISSYSSPSIGDINGDGFPDLLIGSNRITSPCGFQVMNQNGKVVWSRNYGYTYTSASLGDINGDGTLNIAGQIKDSFYVWKTTSTIGKNALPWPTYMGNPAHTGVFEGVEPPPSPDTQPPSAPTGLTAQAIAYNQVNLQWNASTDNVQVAGYNIYRNNSIIATTSATSYSDKTVVGNTTYTYTVSAYDLAGNTSSQSNPVSITTPSPPSSQYGSLTGKVLDASTSFPLIGAKITISTPGYRQVGYSGTDGTYQISNLPEGTYSVKVSVKNYISQTKYITVVANTTLIVDFSLTRRR